jgi:hypothetical protein
MKIAERFDNLDTMIKKKKIIRWKWKDEKGRVCLLAAISPECAESGWDSCPAELVPKWLAAITVRIDDQTSRSEWRDIVNEYARSVRAGAENLNKKGWERVKARFVVSLVQMIEDAYGADKNTRKVKALCRRILRGEKPRRAEWYISAAFPWKHDGEWSLSWLALAGSGDYSMNAAVDAVGDATEKYHYKGQNWDLISRALFAAIDAEVR